MKKVVCLLLALCLVPVCVFASDLDDFNFYAEIFGVPEIKDGTINNSYTIYKIENGTVAFQTENGILERIFVTGEGMDFLSYAMAAVMVFDKDSKDFQINAGLLFSAWLMGRDETGSGGRIATGETLFLKKDNNGLIMTIGR